MMDSTSEDVENGNGSFKNEAKKGLVLTKTAGQALSWKDVSMTVTDKKGQNTKKILSSVSGQTLPGETTAILGPSGAGKTSLFNILAGRVQVTSNLTITGTIHLGGQEVNPRDIDVRRQIAFVAQEDTLHTSSTPREAIRFSARLRLPTSVTDDDIEEIVDTYIHELGLDDCADTIIGGGLKKGISGGEKKRTSVGVELVVRPSLIMLDEPTSGLDSFAAERIISVLGVVARSGASVIFTIHQPSSEVFSSFDNVMLMKKGRIMYRGKAKDLTDDWEELQSAVPKNYNPADWIMRVAEHESDEDLEYRGFFAKFEPSSIDVQKQASQKDIISSSKQQRISFFTELATVVERERKSMIRENIGLVISIFITAFLSTINGLIFLGAGGKDFSDPTKLAAANGAVINNLLSTMMGSPNMFITKLPRDRPLFLREYSTNHYGIISYQVAQFSSEAIQVFIVNIIQCLIIYFAVDFQMNFFIFVAITYSLALSSVAIAVCLSSFFSTEKPVQSSFTLAVVPQFYFSGLFLPITLIPSFIRWAQYTCSLKFAAGLTHMYEFGSCRGGEEADVNCERLLDSNGVDTGDKLFFWVMMGVIWATFRVIAMINLRLKGKF